MTVRASLLAPLLAALACLVGAVPAGAALPRRASSFVNSVGVNVHMSYFDTAYNHWQEVRDKLVELGVRHVRDSACVGCKVQRRRLLALGQAGIWMDYVMRQPGSPDPLPSLVDLLAGPMRSTVDSIEGPNEYDRSGDPHWASHLRAYQRQLGQLVRSEPRLRGVPVIAPSLVSAPDYFKLGNLAHWVDFGNIHPYAGGQVPLANLAPNVHFEGVVAPHRRIVVTEAGYHNALASHGGHRPVSEAADADYVPRLFLDFFRAGIARTYLYELVDEWPDPAHVNQEKNFGLLRNDFSEKPAFRTLKALLSAVRTVGSPRFRLRPLDYGIQNSPWDLRRLLLQTGRDSYALVLWENTSVWDTTRLRPLAARGAIARLTVAGGARAVSVTSLGRRRPVRLNRGGAVRVGAMPVVVRIAPRHSARRGA
jgi:hypothetical protein